MSEYIPDDEVKFVNRLTLFENVLMEGDCLLDDTVRHLAFVTGRPPFEQRTRGHKAEM